MARACLNPNFLLRYTGVDRYIYTQPIQWMIAYTMSLSAKQAAEQVGLSNWPLSKLSNKARFLPQRMITMITEKSRVTAELFRVYQPAVHGLPQPTALTNSQPQFAVDSC